MSSHSGSWHIWQSEIWHQQRFQHFKRSHHRDSQASAIVAIGNSHFCQRYGKRIIKEKLSYQSYSMKTSAFVHLSPLRKAKASCSLGNQHHYIWKKKIRFSKIMWKLLVWVYHNSILCILANQSFSANSSASMISTFY